MGTPLQYSCPRNPMDRSAWRATVHGVTGIGHDRETKTLPQCVRCCEGVMCQVLKAQEHGRLYSRVEGTVRKSSLRRGSGFEA